MGAIIGIAVGIVLIALGVAVAVAAYVVVQKRRKAALNETRRNVPMRNSVDFMTPRPVAAAAAATAAAAAVAPTPAPRPAATMRPAVAPKPASRLSRIGFALPVAALPPGWTQVVDPDTNSPYYYNSKTGKTQWEKPTDHNIN